MLPAEARLPGARLLIDTQRYFVLHAPRQTGKTTTVAALAKSLNAEGRYAAVLASCEEAQAVGDDIELGVTAILNEIVEAGAGLPQPQRPPQVASFDEVEAVSRLKVYLSRWCEGSPLPVVLFLDEIDAVIGKTLTSVLRQIRVGYTRRPDRFPQSVALVGMRDVRDYKASEGERFHTASPFNIKDRTFLLPNFTADEVATLYEQHTEVTGQVITEGAKARAYELSRPCRRHPGHHPLPDRLVRERRRPA